MRKYLLYTTAALAVWAQSCRPERPALYNAPKQDTVVYTESNEDFANPERGFYRYAETSAAAWTPLEAARLKTWRTLQKADDGSYQIYSTLVFWNIVLTGLSNKPLPGTLLDALSKDFATAREAGVKLIPRFAYNVNPTSGSCPEGFICPPYGDAALQTVLGQIAQLKPLLKDNADVISCLQMGFVGTWGENFYSDYFGDPSSNGAGQLYDSNWAAKSAVLKALLGALPANRMIQVRTPQMKQRYLGGADAPPSLAGMKAADAFTGTDQARIGFHNDCFLSSPDDYGTFFDLGNSSSAPSASAAPLRAYAMNDGTYTPVGGETCDDAYSPENDCESAGHAQTEMSGMHYSFLNCAYNNDVNNDWQTGGCMESIKRNLGYRFVLRQAVFPHGPVTGGSFKFRLLLQNQGYASPFNEHPAVLILRDQQTRTEITVPTSLDIRHWFTGPVTEDVSVQPSISVPAGRYDLFLYFPDAAPSLKGRVEYAIRLANDATWDETTGYNNLNHVLEVK